MYKLFIILFTAIFFHFSALAQLPRKVDNVTLRDLHNNEVALPYFGEKNLLIFYIDPDTGLGRNKNIEYSELLEQYGVAKGGNIYGFGILNLGDTFLPKRIIRSMARRRTAKNGGYVLEDADHTLRDKWQIGDCNGRFCFMIVTKSGELVFLQKEEISDSEQSSFIDFVREFQ